MACIDSIYYHVFILPPYYLFLIFLVCKKCSVLVYCFIYLCIYFIYLFIYLFIYFIYFRCGFGNSQYNHPGNSRVISVQCQRVMMMMTIQLLLILLIAITVMTIVYNDDDDNSSVVSVYNVRLDCCCRPLDIKSDWIVAAGH
jgi:hypothetical protein